MYVYDGYMDNGLNICVPKINGKNGSIKWKNKPVIVLGTKHALDEFIPIPTL